MSCPKGEIMRNAYVRKAHSRKSYSRGSKKIRGSYVKKTKVPRSCVSGRGKLRKSRPSERILPPIGKEISLRHYGYHTHESAALRRKALNLASDEYNPLAILRHLNLIRNYQLDKDAKYVMSEDVNYMKRKYAAYKVQQGRGSKKRSRRSKKN
jgi:hypothetical protein